MSRMPVRPRIAPFPPWGCPLGGLRGIRRNFFRLSPWNGRVAYVLLTRAPVAGGCIATSPLPLDLHVLGLSLAFILSQDQTLRCCYFLFLFSVSFNGNAMFFSGLAIDFALFDLSVVFRILTETFVPSLIASGRLSLSRTTLSIANISMISVSLALRLFCKASAKLMHFSPLVKTPTELFFAGRLVSAPNRLTDWLVTLCVKVCRIVNLSLIIRIYTILCPYTNTKETHDDK